MIMYKNQSSEEFFAGYYDQHEDDYVGPDRINNLIDQDTKTPSRENVTVEMQQLKRKEKFVDDGIYTLATLGGDKAQLVVEIKSKVKKFLRFLTGFVLAVIIFLLLELGVAFNQSGHKGELSLMSKHV